MKVDLKAERLNRGLSVRKLAHEAGVSATSVERAERGVSLHPGNAKKIADFLGYRVTDIWPIGKDGREDD